MVGSVFPQGIEGSDEAGIEDMVILVDGGSKRVFRVGSWPTLSS